MSAQHYAALFLMPEVIGLFHRPPVPIPEGYTLLKEGQATILQHGNDVFYNPAQVSFPPDCILTVAF